MFELNAKMAKIQSKNIVSVDDFEVISTIGSGSYGTVKKVMRIKDKKILVWKELNYSFASENDKQMLVSEVNLLRELKHDHIVRYVDRIVDRKKSILFLIMEYCEGGDLASYIAKIKKEGLSIEENFIWKVCFQLTQALKECHSKNKYGKSVLHRDLKPANIFLDSNLNVKLGDFGLARVLKHDNSFAKTCVGTPLYMSPELMSGIEYNEKCDIWALGCLLYELCSLKPPFIANNQVELAAKICSGKFDRIPKTYSQKLFSLISSLLDVNVVKRPSIDILLQITSSWHYCQDLTNEEKPKVKPTSNNDKSTVHNELDTLKEEINQLKNDLVTKKIELKKREKEIELKEKSIEKKLIDIESREKNLSVIEKMVMDRMSRAEKLMKIYTEIDNKNINSCYINADNYINGCENNKKSHLQPSNQCLDTNKKDYLQSPVSEISSKRRKRLNSFGSSREKNHLLISPRVTDLYPDFKNNIIYNDVNKNLTNENLLASPLHFNKNLFTPLNPNIIDDGQNKVKYTLKTADRKPLKRLDKYEVYKGPIKALPITSTPAIIKAPSYAF